MSGDSRLPTAMWVEAHVRQCSASGIPVYIAHKGDYAGGLVLLKISNMEGVCRLLAQQRDLDGVLGWMGALGDTETVNEADAEAYIKRALDRDPDLWVVEIEDREMNNPFEGKVF